MASHFNAGLVPYVKQEGVKYFFGIPEGKERGELKEYNYTVTKNITQYLQSKENTNPSLMDLDKLYYQVETEKFFEIGDTVKYEDKTLYVKEVHLQIEQAILKNTYKLTTKKGCSQDKCYNEKIIGLSLQGSVLETSKDQLKLHLAIDKSQDVGKAWFFKYATPYTASGHSGWYCMPELDDTVYAYFPTKDEGEGIAFSSIRTKDLGSDKLSDTAIKYLRTKYGKELKFAPGELLITCIDEGIFIKLNDKTGIEIFSTKPIKIHTPQDLTVDSGKKIYMTAQEEINLTCKASNIKMDGDIVVQGKEVKSN